MDKSQKRGVPEGSKLTRLEQRLAKATKKSGFAVYLATNWDAFVEIIKRYGVNWDEVAQWALDEGITGGKSLTGDSAKKAYYRERRRRAASPKKARRAQPAGTSSAVTVLTDPKPAEGKKSDGGEAQRALSRMKRTMAERSGRKPDEET